MAYLIRSLLILLILIPLNQQINSAQSDDVESVLFPYLPYEYTEDPQHRLSSPVLIDIFVGPDKIPMKAWVDTGNSRTNFTETAAKKLGLTLGEDFSLAEQIGSTMQSRSYITNETTLIRTDPDSEGVRLLPEVTTDEDTFEGSSKTHQELAAFVDVFLGADFIKLTEFTFDVPNKRLEARTLGAENTTGSHENFYVPVNVQGEAFWCFVDTGSPFADGIFFDINHPARDRLLSNSARADMAWTTSAHTGRAYVIYDDTARIKGLDGQGSLIYLETGFEGSDKLTEDEHNICVVGLQTLSNATVHYTQENGLILTGQMPPAYYNRTGFLGMEFYFDGDAVLVTKIRSTSPAYKAGMRANFVIYSIDGVRLSPDNLHEAQRAFFQPAGTKVTIEWLSGPDENGFDRTREKQVSEIELYEALR